jgi:hypothetical protein
MATKARTVAALEAKAAELRRRVEQLTVENDHFRSELDCAQGSALLLVHTNLTRQQESQLLQDNAFLKKKYAGLDCKTANLERRVLQLKKANAALREQLLEQDVQSAEISARTQKTAAAIDEGFVRTERMETNIRQNEKMLQHLTSMAKWRTAQEKKRVAFLDAHDIIAGLRAEKPEWKEAFAALDKHYASVEHAETEDIDAETEAITAKKGDDDEDEPDLFDEPGLVEKLRPLADGIRTTRRSYIQCGT